MDFIEAIENAINRKAEKIFFPMQQGDVFKTYADTSKLENEIGYKSSVTFKEEIRKFLEWYNTTEH